LECKCIVQQYIGKRLGLIEDESPVDFEYVDPGYEKEGKKWKLHWEIHSGTVMSRDIGDSYYFHTIEECKRKILQIEKDMNRLGFKIHFAHAYLIGKDEYVKVHEGTYCG